MQSLIESGHLAGHEGQLPAGHPGRAARGADARAAAARGAHRPAARAREAGAADGGGDRQGVSASRSWRRWPSCRSASSTRRCAPSRPRSSSTSSRSTRWRSTPSSTRSRRRSRSTRSCASGGAASHAAVARTIEAAHADKLDEQAALLAHHWEEAGQSADRGALAPPRRRVGRNQRHRGVDAPLAAGARADRGGCGRPGGRGARRGGLSPDAGLRLPAGAVAGRGGAGLQRGEALDREERRREGRAGCSRRPTPSSRSPPARSRKECATPSRDSGSCCRPRTRS